MAYSLVRFSYYTQKMGDSTRRQVELADNWLKQHPECTLDTSLNMRQLGGARAVSAFHGKQRSRGGLAAFIKAVEMGRVKRGSVLLVESLDRLSREQVEDALDLFLQIIKLGVTIVTLAEPAAEFTRGQLDMTKLIIAIVVMSRGHEESATKSRRLKEKWNVRRVQAAKHEKIITAHPPKWLIRDGEKWKIDYDKVKIIRRMFKDALTIGVYQIAKKLNRENVPTLGRSKHWDDSQVVGILRNRRLIGEYQPQNDKRQNMGEVVPDYYPKVIREDLFFKVQATMDGRKRRRGRVGEGVSCLVTGLWRDALHKLPFNVLTRRYPNKVYRYMYAVAADRALPGAPAICFPYDRFESVLLQALSGEVVEHLRDMDEQDTEDEQRALAGQLASTEDKIARLTANIAESGSFETGLKILRDLEARRDDLRKQLDTLKGATPKNDTLDSIEEASRVYRLMEGEQSEERTEVRQLLRAKIAELVESIDILLYRTDQWQCLDAQINFRSGGESLLFHVRVKGKQEEWAVGWWVDDVTEDLKNYSPKRYETRWDEQKRQEKKRQKK